MKSITSVALTTPAASTVTLLDLPSDVLEYIIQLSIFNHKNIALTSKQLYALINNVFSDYLEADHRKTPNPRKYFFENPAPRLKYHFWGKKSKELLDKALQDYITINAETLEQSQIDFLNSAFLISQITANKVSLEAAINFVSQGYEETIKNILESKEGQQLNEYEQLYLKSYKVAFQIYYEQLSVNKAKADISLDTIGAAFQDQTPNKQTLIKTAIGLGLSPQAINLTTLSEAHIKAVKQGIEYQTIADLLPHQLLEILRKSKKQDCVPQEVLELTERQKELLNLGLTPGQISSLQDYHYPAIQEGFEIAQIKALNANQVLGLLKHNLTIEQVSHSNFSTFHLAAMKRGSSYEEVIGFTRTELKEKLENLPASAPTPKR